MRRLPFVVFRMVRSTPHARLKNDISFARGSVLASTLIPCIFRLRLPFFDWDRLLFGSGESSFRDGFYFDIFFLFIRLHFFWIRTHF
jgi:hypothetical protein